MQILNLFNIKKEKEKKIKHMTQKEKLVDINPRTNRYKPKCFKYFNLKTKIVRLDKTQLCTSWTLNKRTHI